MAHAPGRLRSWNWVPLWCAVTTLPSLWWACGLCRCPRWGGNHFSSSIVWSIAISSSGHPPQNIKTSLFQKILLVVPPLKLVCRSASLVNTYICIDSIWTHDVSFVIASEQKQSGHHCLRFTIPFDFCFYLCHLVPSLRRFWPWPLFQMPQWLAIFQLYWRRAWPQNRPDVAVWGNVRNVLKLRSGERKMVLRIDTSRAGCSKTAIEELLWIVLCSIWSLKFGNETA